MKNWWKHVVAAGFAVAILGAGIATNPAFADPLKDRKAAMKSISKANKVIVGYTKGKGDLTSAVAAAKKIASLAETLPVLFPHGSGMGYGTKTRAKPAIWTDWAKFQKASGSLVKAANNFANWSRMGSDDTLKSASGAIRKSCGGCHKPFRGPKPKKR
jgi:cytochrome c556